MFVMYDSVDLEAIPREPHAVAYYINGDYAHDRKEIESYFPHARLLSLSVTGDETVADGYDIERGDYRPEQAKRLFTTAKDGGIWRPCFYASLDLMPAVKGNLNGVVTNRSDVRLWVADYDGLPILALDHYDYDAHQFTDRALGRNLDESICQSSFFRSVPVHTPKILKTTVNIDVNVDTNEWKFS